MILRSTLIALSLLALPAVAIAQTASPASPTVTTAPVKKARMHKPTAAATTTTASTSAAAPGSSPTAATSAVPKRVHKTAMAVPSMPAAAPAPMAARTPAVTPAPQAATAVAGVSKSGKPRTEKQLAADLKRKACANDWQAAKAAGTTGGKKWPQFLSACYKTKV